MLNITKPNYAECRVNGQIIDSSHAIKNKLFHEDILNDDFSLKSSQREKFEIGGTIKLKNTYTFGFNEKGQELFEFVPINWRYPKFLVPSNIKKNLIKRKQKVTDYYVVIKYVQWMGKIPLGIIERNVGSIDNILHRYEILFNYYPEMPIKNTPPSNSIDKLDVHDVMKHEVYTIDPEGCEDIDDAISYDVKNNRIGIHITDLTELIPSSFSFNKFSTIYAPHKRIDMFSSDIATVSASLKAGYARPVITCWLENDKHYFERNNIIVTKNLTYDEAEKMLDSDLQELFEKSKELGKLFNIDVVDTHKMIEVYMIFYNNSMAKYLSKPIFRNQIDHEKAQYSWTEIGHSSLGLSSYTHATSPIRRYVDFVIQMIYRNKPIGVIDLTIVNHFEVSIQKLNRMWDYMKASTEIKSGTKYEIELKKIEKNRLIFSCEALKIFISNKINFLVTKTNEIEVNKNTYTIGNKYNMPLYLVEDKKNATFVKILIQF